MSSLKFAHPSAPHSIPTLTEYYAQVDDAIHTIVAWHVKRNLPTPTYTEIADFRNTLKTIAEFGHAPYRYLEILGSGSFKECYVGLGEWIVKFCSHFNDTNSEEQILRAAKAATLENVFIDTIFIRLPSPAKATIADIYGIDDYWCDLDEASKTKCQRPCSNCDHYHHPTPYILNAIEFQPQARITAHTQYCYVPFTAEAYLRQPIYYNSGKIVPYEDIYKSNINSMDWIKQFIAVYGDADFQIFLQFIKEFDIRDLSGYNVGYLGSHPVILDWISHRPR